MYFATNTQTKRFTTQLIFYFLKHVYPGHKKYDEKYSEESGRDDDTEDIGKKKTNEIVGVIEEKNSNGEV